MSCVLTDPCGTAIWLVLHYDFLVGIRPYSGLKRLAICVGYTNTRSIIQCM